MTKKEFMKHLKQTLKQLRPQERKQTLAYYSEIIDDRMENGYTEAQAVAETEPVDVIAARMLGEAAQQDTLKPKRDILHIVLLVVGFPVWLPLLLAIAVIVFAVFIIIWAAVFVLFAADVSFAVMGIGGIAGGIAYFGSKIPTALFLVGCGLICVAIALLLFFPLCKLTKLLASGSAALWKKQQYKLCRKAGNQI